MEHLGVFRELILNIVGFTLSNRRHNNVFKAQDLNNARINSLKYNLDKKSIEVIDALLFLANNKHKKNIQK